MSDLSTYARIKAWIDGSAVRLSRTRNFPVSTRPLVLIPIQMAGEAPALFGIGIGDLQGHLQVFTCPNPTNRDQQYAFLTDVANVIKDTLAIWSVDVTTMPQIICQSDAAATLLLAVVDRMAFANTELLPSPVIRDVGRQLIFFDKRFEHPDSAAIISATGAVTQLYATGQDPQADTHLATLVEWLKPADGNVIDRVKKAEKSPASISTDPRDDNEILAEHVDTFYRAVKEGADSEAAMARHHIHVFLKNEIERRHRLIIDAMAAVTAIPETSQAIAIAARDHNAFCRHVTYVLADPRLARGFLGDSGILEYVFRDVAYRDQETESVQAIGRHRSESRINGEILFGEVVAKRNSRQGSKRIVEYEIVTSQDRMRTRPGTTLALMDCPEGLCFKVQTMERQQRGLLIGLQMTAGMTKSGHPNIGDHIDLGPISRFSRRTQHARDRLTAAGSHSVVTGPGANGIDYLAVVSKFEGKP